jgi:hypothetical protein
MAPNPTETSTSATSAAQYWYSERPERLAVVAGGGSTDEIEMDV